MQGQTGLLVALLLCFSFLNYNNGTPPPSQTVAANIKEQEENKTPITETGQGYLSPFKPAPSLRPLLETGKPTGWETAGPFFHQEPPTWGGGAHIHPLTESLQP